MKHVFGLVAVVVMLVACGWNDDAVVSTTSAVPPTTTRTTTTTATTTIVSTTMPLPASADMTAVAADHDVDMVRADDIPVVHTPPGGWEGAFPEPVLAACTEPLVDEAPELRGLWRVIEVEDTEGVIVADHPALGHYQRIEQCGNRLVVTAGGVIHDMRCDGTLDNGVDDVAERDTTTRIRVAATYENAVHVLRPDGLPIEITRRRDGEHLVWQYLTFTARLEWTGPPEIGPPG